MNQIYKKKKELDTSYNIVQKIGFDKKYQRLFLRKCLFT